MRLYSKERLPDGRRNVYVRGVKIFSYTPGMLRVGSSKIFMRGEDNELVNATPNNPELTVNIYARKNGLIILTDKIFCTKINIGTYDCEVTDCEIVIGKDTSSNGLNIILPESGRQKEAYCVLAGTPAKAVKRGVT